MQVRAFKYKRLFIIFLLVFSCGLVPSSAKNISITTAFAMPFFNLNPKDIVVRASFSTEYKSSSSERKHNIKLAAKKLNKTLVDVGKEFSFNSVVGARTEKNGFKSAKIIVNGDFTDGVGGGVCQVSSTLYNAVLLAGLKITKRYPHSLKVNYAAPSFDAMVNSGYADLRFINNTDNPVIVMAKADDEKITITILGEKLQEQIYRESRIILETDPPESEIVFDELGEYPDLFEGESKVIRYGSKGLVSEGYLIIVKNGKKNIIKLSKDRYNGIRGKVVVGKAIRETPPEIEIAN